MEEDPDMRSIDQYVLALVGMRHADPEKMPDNSIRGKTWLQKIMYITSKSCGTDMFGFTPYKYGMYSKQLDESVERCIRGGLICTHQSDGNGAIHMTARGGERLDLGRCDDVILRQMQSTKSLLNGLDYREMIAYSYALFPEMTEDSELVDDFRVWRVDAATSMYLKGAVSLALAARISDLSRDGFEDHLRRGGIEPHTPLVRTDVVIPTETPAF